MSDGAVIYEFAWPLTCISRWSVEGPFFSQETLAGSRSNTRNSQFSVSGAEGSFTAPRVVLISTKRKCLMMRARRVGSYGFVQTICLKDWESPRDSPALGHHI